MVKCLVERRYANPNEIKAATSESVLQSWRGVWKDRNEDTAYLTGWKRIQDKLMAQIDPKEGTEMLFFKNSPHQFIPHVHQWQDIVLRFHGDADLRHLGVKETIDRIKQVWTVGAKLYGIPEAYIKVCVSSCPLCSSSSSSSSSHNNIENMQHKQSSSKRRRFEYTESFEVQAKEVPRRLQELAAKHQVVLCIRQKYIRFKPFLAEVKDYCCHRAGEPNMKKPGLLKRKRYSSKRCGCGFRIRAIVPITNYSEKEKSFSYLEEGQAVFKLYAIHSGHEPGPHEGSARIMHRLVGSSGMQNMDTISPFEPEEEPGSVSYVKNEGEAREIVMQQVHELCVELQLLDQKMINVSQEALNGLSQDLATMIHRLKNVEDLDHRNHGLLLSKNNDDDGNDLMLGHHSELVHDHINSDFGSSLGSDNHWERQSLDIPAMGDGGSVSLKESCSHYGGNGISASDREVVIVISDDRPCGVQMTDSALVTIPVDNYYQENVKWYDGMSCALDPTTDELSHSVQGGFRHSLV